MRVLRPSLALYLAAALAACSSAGPVLADCTAGQGYRGAPRSSAPDELWRRDFTRSIEGSLPPELVSRLEAALDATLAHYPAVSAAVALPGEGTWVATRGVANAKSRAPATSESLFQVASITKALAAVVVLQLVEEGKLGLATPVDRWFPDVPHASLITVESLLDHTSGLPSFNALPDGRKLGPKHRPPEELVEIAAGYDPHFCPGTGWAYTNTGYVMLGRIVEAVESKPFAEVLAARVLEPLSLERTLLRRPGVELPAVVAGHAGGEPIDGEIDYAMPYTAGALASTASDLVRFWHALLSGKLLPAERMRAAFRDMYPMQPLIPAPPGVATFYKRGTQLTEAPGDADGPGLMLEHAGGMPGFNAVVAYLAEDDAYVAVAVNDKEKPAAAGLWMLVRELRANRRSGQRR